MLTSLCACMFCLAYMAWKLSGQTLSPQIPRTIAIELLTETAMFTIAFIIMVCYVVGLYGSHKIAGPIYRFEVTARKIAEGDLTDARIWLRKGDEFQELCDLFNVILSNERKLITGLRESLESLADVMIIQKDEHPDSQKTERFSEAVELISDLTQHYEV